MFEELQQWARFPYKVLSFIAVAAQEIHTCSPGTQAIWCQVVWCLTIVFVPMWPDWWINHWINKGNNVTYQTKVKIQPIKIIWAMNVPGDCSLATNKSLLLSIWFHYFKTRDREIESGTDREIRCEWDIGRPLCMGTRHWIHSQDWISSWTGAQVCDSMERVQARRRTTDITIGIRTNDVWQCQKVGIGNNWELRSLKYTIFFLVLHKIERRNNIQQWKGR